MEDNRIVALYFERSEEAIEQSQKKYGRMLYTLGFSLLNNSEDAKESENDCYLTAWNKIPPDRPTFLGAYLAKIERYLCMNILKKRTAEKRPTFCEASEELLECIPDTDTVENSMTAGALREVINRFLRSLSDTERYIFVRRYFYNEPLSTIAGNLCFSEGKIKSILFRSREKLKKLLEEEKLL